MAMIPCPNCKEPISDKAPKCPHCNYELIPGVKRICSECGTELENGATVCPRCGRLVEDATSLIEKGKNLQISPKTKKLFVCSISAIVIVTIIILLGMQVQKHNKVQNYNDYWESLQTTAILMLDSAADAEECGNLLENVWYNAINEIEDDVTDKYTRVGDNGIFRRDPTMAVNNLIYDTEYSAKIENIKDDQETARTLLNELASPPDEYECEKAYDALLEFYNAYLDLTNIVIQPSESLYVFSAYFDSAISNTSDCYKTLSIQLGLR